MPSFLQRRPMRAAHLATLATLLGLAGSTSGQAQSPLRATPRFEITFPGAVNGQPITGRVYVALSRTSDARNTPIQQTDETGVPLFGVDVENLDDLGFARFVE